MSFSDRFVLDSQRAALFNLSELDSLIGQTEVKEFVTSLYKRALSELKRGYAQISFCLPPDSHLLVLGLLLKPD